MNKPKVFISWSGKNGKQISIIIKRILEIDVFSGQLSCFVSDTDIESGEEWWKKIKKELKAAKLGIICITKDNIESPWIHFEAGALVGNNVKTVPLLFNCDNSALKPTPLENRQSIRFNDKAKFYKLISEINNLFKIINDEKQFKKILDKAYSKMRSDLKNIEKNLKKEDYFNLRNVYPPEIKTIKRRSVFVSAPMSTISSETYKKQREGLLEVVKVLKDIGFSQVKCPAVDIIDKNHFEGREKAIQDNFVCMKQSDCFVMVYESMRASSALIELGYAIALCKKTVVFYKKSIPYLLQKAGENIAHVRTVKFNKYETIIKELNTNKMALFRGVNED